jgi:3'(2'), 5'-bisphosphate nucleotidase
VTTGAHLPAELPAAQLARFSLRAEVEVALAAVRRATDAVMAIYATDFGVAYKGDVAANDPVTAADHAANAALVDAIAAAFPDDVIVAEESDVPSDYHRARRCWFVDPLDGTRDFVARNGEFCVMVGLAIDGRARLGLVAIPALQSAPDLPAAGSILIGEVDGPAVRLVGDAVVDVRVSTRDDPSTATVVVSRSRRAPLLDTILRALGSPAERPLGSVGVKISALVDGAADAYLHPSATLDPDRPGEGGAKLWDTCAPEAILRAAGGLLTDGLGRDVEYASSELTHRYGIVASNGVLHARLLDAVRASTPRG